MVSSAPYRVIRRVREQLLLVGVVQPQASGATMRSEASPLGGGEVVLGFVEVQPGASRRRTRSTAGTSLWPRRRRRASAAGSTCGTVQHRRRHARRHAPGRSCGSAAATRVSMAHTSSGGSSTDEVGDHRDRVLPGGRLRLVNDAAASTEFGMICSPLPVSMCVARQLTSTTRPRAADVSTQSPIRNGCSNSRAARR